MNGRAALTRCAAFSSTGLQVFSKLTFRACQVRFLRIPVQTTLQCYSHSIVLGGFELISYTTLVTPVTSFTILVDMRSNTSPGSFTQSAVIASSDSTTRTAT